MNNQINNDSLPITEEQLKKADELLKKLIGSLQFFREELHHDPRMRDTKTHMGLFESYFRELSPLVSYDTVLEQEALQRFGETRKLHAEVDRLKSLLGKGVTAEGVSAKLQMYDKVVSAWYGALGFQYASLERTTPYAMTFEFTPELQYEPDDGCSGKKELAAKFAAMFPLMADNPDFEVYRDKYHAELLDTDTNRAGIRELFKETFPGHIISEFRSYRNDYGSYSLRFTVVLPFEDIEALNQSAGEREG